MEMLSLSKKKTGIYSEKQNQKKMQQQITGRIVY